MQDQMSNPEQQWAAQVQALERMIELANELEKVVDQLIEGIFRNDTDDDPSAEAQES